MGRGKCSLGWGLGRLHHYPTPGATTTQAAGRRCHFQEGPLKDYHDPQWVEKRTGTIRAAERGEEKPLGERRPSPPSYLDVPVLIQVIDTGDAAPVAMGIVHVSHVPQPVSWVTCHHGLAEMMETGFTEASRQGLLSKPAITSSFSPFSPSPLLKGPGGSKGSSTQTFLFSQASIHKKPQLPAPRAHFPHTRGTQRLKAKGEGGTEFEMVR